MAFVVILHLSPNQDSALAEMLQQSTAMPVSVATHDVQVEPNRVYVIPPGKQLLTVDGRLGLTELKHQRGRRVAVDLFFRTLADTHGAHAVAIVLSGADGDGAIGIKRIKERGGLTVAQDPEEAEHSGMPRSAIETGMVDWVLKVTEMPARLLTYRQNGKRLKLPPEEGPQPAQSPAAQSSIDEEGLRATLGFLHTHTGRDFSYYKRATLLRRIARRMQVNAVDSIPAYLEFMRGHSEESSALLRELLISVTNFFRDRDCFAALERSIPALFKGKTQGETIRVWVPACATGEEAYSLAILIDEHARTLDSPPGTQVFATDLSADAIQAAREGIYPETIAADVSEDRLQLYFLKEQGGYRVRREIRESVLFAHHDLLKDAPFSRLDLITCRNLLIYLNRDAQARAFDIFNFALRPGGLLFLGSSESVEDGSRAFEALDKRNRIYAARAVPRLGFPVPRGPGVLAHTLHSHERTRPDPASATRPVPVARSLASPPGDLHPMSWSELHFRMAERLSAPSVLVNWEHEILHLSATAGKYLQFSGGEPTSDVLRLVHPEMRVELRAALYRAAQGDAEPQSFHAQVEVDGARLELEVRVAPATDSTGNYFLVVFQRLGIATRPEQPGANTEAEPVTQHLEREIEGLKLHLRQVTEQSEASSEELQASNEELQAMNEEIRSASEELETSREELQSINEELTTVNSELKQKVEDLGRSNSDLQNLISATSIATVFLDRGLCVTRYTPAAVTLFNFIPTDVGRPLSDLTRQRDYGRIEEDAARALDHLAPTERELQIESRWFLARTLPYRTADDRVAGVVLTLFDITARRHAEEALRAAGDELEARVASRTAELAQANSALRAEVEIRQQAEQERLVMVRQLMAAQEDERARISRGLHDEVGQNLAALLLDLKALESSMAQPAGASKIKTMTETVEKLTRQTHELAVELRPTALDDLGLPRALSHYLERWSARTGIRAAFNSSGLEQTRLPASVETTIYRIVCEALNNVTKHADAKCVSVVVQRRPGQAVGIIEDDGKGFDSDASQPDKKIGIVGMKERASLLNGEVTIESRPGGGTVVYVRVPIDTQLADDALR